jgi:hypothetical protein
VFLREHLECVGVELSASMLAQAREKLPDLPFHRADMRAFDLEQRLDVVASLFSAIGYVRSTDELFAAVACMAGHLVLVIEPWFSPEQWNPGPRIHGGMIVDEPELKIVRMVVSEQRDRFAVTPMHHLVATLGGIEHFLETHELLLAEPRSTARHCKPWDSRPSDSCPASSFEACGSAARPPEIGPSAVPRAYRSAMVMANARRNRFRISGGKRAERAWKTFVAKQLSASESSL